VNQKLSRSKMNIPSASEVSVVVQGPIVAGEITKKCLESIHKKLPGAEIILSTWQGSDTAGLEFDRLVENQDPGPIWILNPFVNQTQVNNINRQTVSTVGGLEVATRKYALKFRTDLLLRGANFLNWFDTFQKRSADYKLFEKRILASTAYSRDPRRDDGRCLFHPSDFIFFGLTSDLLKLWQIDAAAYQAGSLTDSERQMVKDGQTVFTRLYAEQCLWVGCMAKHFPDLTLQSFWHTSSELLDKSEKSIANNLVLLQPNQWPVQWMRAHSSHDVIWSLQIYDHADWRALYQKYCDSSATVPSRMPSRIRNLLLPFVNRCQATIKFQRPVRLTFNLLSRLFIRWKIQPDA
jgi:WavE lipopolysaccharide synthesis